LVHYYRIGKILNLMENEVELESIIANQISIDSENLEIIGQRFCPRQVKKGKLLLEAGKRCTEMYFIKTGYLRVYSLVMESKPHYGSATKVHLSLLLRVLFSKTPTSGI